jgi:hypothetical protein
MEIESSGHIGIDRVRLSVDVLLKERAPGAGAGIGAEQVDLPTIRCRP